MFGGTTTDEFSPLDVSHDDMADVPLYLYYNYTMDPKAQIDILQFARLIHDSLIETFQVVRNSEENKVGIIASGDHVIENITNCVMFSTLFSGSDQCDAFDPIQNVESFPFHSSDRILSHSLCL